jgi:Methyltransferase domain
MKRVISYGACEGAFMNRNGNEICQPSPLTGARSKLLFRHQVLGKYEAEYYLDPEIGYIFANAPLWLDEAYSSAITVTDTGCVARNIRNVEVIKSSLGRENFRDRGVDLGGGHGLFVRGMRDAGYDFYWTDKYAANIFARGFEAERGNFGCATAFEILEHLENPLQFLQEAAEKFRFDTCFFSATCFNESDLPGLDWWYWSFETGQHISFFSRPALTWIAGVLDMKLWHIKDDIFAFSRRPWGALPKREGGAVWGRVRRRIDGLLDPKVRQRRPSLTFPDHIYLREQLAEKQRR